MEGFATEGSLFWRFRSLAREERVSSVEEFDPPQEREREGLGSMIDPASAVTCRKKR